VVIIPGTIAGTTRVKKNVKTAAINPVPTIVCTESTIQLSEKESSASGPHVTAHALEAIRSQKSSHTPNKPEGTLFGNRSSIFLKVGHMSESRLPCIL
jgi:hypothetical protein